MYLAPISIDQNLAGAIPIEVWTETSVIGDISNRFGTSLTEKSTVWLKLDNKQLLKNSTRSFNEKDSIPEEEDFLI